MALVAAYSFDEAGGTVIDYSGGSHSFPLTSSAIRVAGHETGKALQAASVTPLAMPDIGRDDARTVMMWVKGALDEDAWLIEWHVDADDTGAFGILSIQGDIAAQGENAAATVARARVAWPDDAAWHHVAAAYDGSTVSLFLDGILADCVALTAPLRVDSDPPRLLGWVGTPAVDDVRVYDSALDQTAVQAAMATVVTAGDFTKSAALAVDAAFINRVTVATAHYAVAVGNGYLAAPGDSAEAKARYLLAQRVIAEPVAYGVRFAWAVAADAGVDGTVDDASISDRVANVWNLFAGVPA